MKKFSIIIFIFITIYAIKAQNRLPNVSRIYNPTQAKLHPIYKIYNLNDSISRIYFRLNLNEISFNSKIAKIRIKYILFASLKKFKIIDSSSKIFILKKLTNRTSLISFWQINTKAKKGILAIILYDLQQNVSALNFIYLDKTIINSDNFLLKNADNYKIVMRNFMINSKNGYFIETTLPYDSLFMIRYKIDSTAAAPPYSEITKKFKPIILDISKIAVKDTIYFKKPGIYLFSPDTINPHGLSVEFFRNDFPYIRYPIQMIDPLIYITSSRSFLALKSAKNPKLAVDGFWIKNSGEDKFLAKELIRIFYNRVLLANFYFTSYKEGWRTDRGMIYIIFGPPSAIYKDEEKETWSYVISSSFNQVNFEFYKKQNQFSENCYILRRKAEYLKVWRKMLNYWNTGNIIEY